MQNLLYPMVFLLLGCVQTLKYKFEPTLFNENNPLVSELFESQVVLVDGRRIPETLIWTPGNTIIIENFRRSVVESMAKNIEKSSARSVITETEGERTGHRDEHNLKVIPTIYFEALQSAQNESLLQTQVKVDLIDAKKGKICSGKGSANIIDNCCRSSFHNRAASAISQAFAKSVEDCNDKKTR